MERGEKARVIWSYSRDPLIALVCVCVEINQINKLNLCSQSFLDYGQRGIIKGGLKGIKRNPPLKKYIHYGMLESQRRRSGKLEKRKGKTTCVFAGTGSMIMMSSHFSSSFYSLIIIHYYYVSSAGRVDTSVLKVGTFWGKCACFWRTCAEMHAACLVVLLSLISVLCFSASKCPLMILNMKLLISWYSSSLLRRTGVGYIFLMGN